MGFLKTTLLNYCVKLKMAQIEALDADQSQDHRKMFLMIQFWRIMPTSDYFIASILD